MGLTPLSKFRDELTFFSSPKENRCCINQDGIFEPLKPILIDNNNNDINDADFELSLVEESDLPEVALFIVKSFGADVISMTTGEFSDWEKRLMAPAMDFFNNYAALTAFSEVLWGLRIRQADRVPLTTVAMHREQEKQKKNADKKIATTTTTEHQSTVVNDILPPNLHGLKSAKEKINAANRKSLVLLLARKSANPSTNGNNANSKWESVESNIDVIASVELRLQVSSYARKKRRGNALREPWCHIVSDTMRAGSSLKLFLLCL